MASDGITTVPNYLTLTGNSLALLAPDISYNSFVGTHVVRLHVKLDDYNLVTHYDDFNAIINECVPTISPASAPSAVAYQLGTTEKTTSFVDFTQTPACGYTFTYTATETDGTALTDPPIGLTDKTFSVHSTNVAHVNTYTVRIIATLDNTPQTFDDSVTFTIDI